MSDTANRTKRSTRQAMGPFGPVSKVVDGQGNTVREIPARDALEILSGDRPVGLGVDAVG